VVQREVARLGATGADPVRRERLLEDFRYLGDETCATDGLCATACPVGIDTGAFVKTLRAAAHGVAAHAVARSAASSFAAVSAGLRGALAVADAGHAVLGSRLAGAIARGARVATGGKLPLWNPAMPRPSHAGPFRDRVSGRERRVVYFPSCVVRTFGPARGDAEASAFEATLSVLDKARFDVVFPRGLEKLCCGMPFESKGFLGEADAKARELGDALLEATRGGEVPVLCDTSPCLYRMRKTLDPRLRLHEPVEFARQHLLGALRLQRVKGPVAIHTTCSATKLGLGEALREVALACAEEVVVPAGVGCCGFAGDRGFSHPELNASALQSLRAAIPAGCTEGYSTSRTCEIGLSLHAGIPYRSIMNLLDRCSRPLEEAPAV
jgi:D-lactate dehydrogenase